MPIRRTPEQGAYTEGVVDNWHVQYLLDMVREAIQEGKSQKIIFSGYISQASGKKTAEILGDAVSYSASSRRVREMRTISHIFDIKTQKT